MALSTEKIKKSSLTRDFPIKIKHLVLMASYAFSNVKTIQIYGDKNCALGSGGACGVPFSCNYYKFGASPYFEISQWEHCN